MAALNFGMLVTGRGTPSLGGAGAGGNFGAQSPPPVVSDWASRPRPAHFKMNLNGTSLRLTAAPALPTVRVHHDTVRPVGVSLSAVTVTVTGTDSEFKLFLNRHQVLYDEFGSIATSGILTTWTRIGKTVHTCLNITGIVHTCMYMFIHI